MTMTADYLPDTSHTYTLISAKSNSRSNYKKQQFVHIFILALLWSGCSKRDTCWLVLTWDQS